ncbi:hypothetical protein [Lysinibacillus sp. 3P01SB]|uniref:hypothetical protein n=1 Tax=Lysinibacillus sp. 3P01SB TaxID=3132284 RepID=UPI0039A5A007
MIRLRNYSKLGSFILIGNNHYTIVEGMEKNKERNGVGGVSDNGEVVGIYVKDEKLYFFIKGFPIYLTRIIKYVRMSILLQKGVFV